MNTIKDRIVGLKAKFKRSVNDRVNRFKCWWNDNQDWARLSAPVVIGFILWLAKVLITFVIKIIWRSITKHDDQAKELRMYDYSLRRFIYLKHGLNGYETEEFYDRRQAGESVYEALDNMDLIKRGRRH